MVATDNKQKPSVKQAVAGTEGKNLRKYFDPSSNCLIHPGGIHSLLLRHPWFLPQWLRRSKNRPLLGRNTKIIAPKQSAKIGGLKLDVYSLLHAQKVPLGRPSDLFHGSQAQQGSRDILPRVPHKEKS